MKKKLLFAIFSSLTVLGSAQVPTLSLEAWYPFTHSANDFGPNGYNGTNHGAVFTADRFGNDSSAYDFSSGGYIDCNNILNSVIAGSGKQMTISFWVKPSASNANNMIIAKSADAGCAANDREFFIRSLNNVVNVEYYGSTAGSTGRFVCGSTLMNNYTKWYNVVVTYDGTITTNNGLDRVKIYVDNTLETTSLSCRSQAGSFPFDIASGAAHFGIGNYLNSTGTTCLSTTNYDGFIDDIRIYSRVLSATEIDHLYNEPNAVGVPALTNTIQLNVYPNPASDHVNLEITGIDAKSEILMENELGQVVYSNSINATEHNKEINTGGLAKGIYMIRVTSDKKLLTSKKIVIE